MYLHTRAFLWVTGSAAPCDASLMHGVRCRLFLPIGVTHHRSVEPYHQLILTRLMDMSEETHTSATYLVCTDWLSGVRSWQRPHAGAWGEVGCALQP